jgi:hypothetical protein
MEPREMKDNAQGEEEPDAPQDGIDAEGDGIRHGSVRCSARKRHADEGAGPYVGCYMLSAHRGDPLIEESNECLQGTEYVS